MITYGENDLSLADYFRLRESVGWRNFEEQAAGALAGSSYVVAARKRGETVGMGRVIGDGLYFNIVDVVVCPRYQGKGVGSAILGRLLAYIERTLPPGGRASVWLISEAGREPFYERLGFKRIPHEHCGSGMRRILRRESPAEVCVP